MPWLTVISKDPTRRLPFRPGVSLRAILEEAGILIRSGCRGDGACGLCRVKIEQGTLPAPGQSELLTLSSADLELGVRLACQLIPASDLTIRILSQPSNEGWKALAPEYLARAPSVLGLSAAKGGLSKAYGLAVDLGTTHICLSLWDLNQGQRLFSRSGLNPQSRFGSDVVTRLVSAAESEDNARELARLPLEAIHAGLLEGCSLFGLNPEDVRRVAVVGNTAMLLLLTHSDPHPLLQPDNWTRPIACRPPDSASWLDLLGVHPEAVIEVVPPLAGFVGSDLLAGVLAVPMTQDGANLLIDFGTNSEIALWDGAGLLVTSAAGGPAFEGSGLQCGMPAEPGAIYQAAAPSAGAELDFQVIGGGQPRGFCGSGLVDLIACLRRSQNLTPVGKLVNLNSPGCFNLCRDNPALLLTGADVDLFQRAKAAIGVGVQALLSRAGINLLDLKRVFVCGAFGQHLDVANAQFVGLLPAIPPERIELCGNTALAGCEQLLLLPASAAQLASMRGHAAIINLSHLPDFAALFLENLYLQPQQEG